jgi:hypothetical protein
MYTGGPKTGSKDADPLDDKTCTKFLSSATGSHNSLFYYSQRTCKILLPIKTYSTTRNAFPALSEMTSFHLIYLQMVYVRS